MMGRPLATLRRALATWRGVPRAAEDQRRAAALNDLIDVSRWLRPWEPPPPSPEAKHITVPNTCFRCYSQLACDGACGGSPRPSRFAEIPVRAQPPEFADVWLDEGRR